LQKLASGNFQQSLHVKKDGIFRWMATGSSFLKRARVALRAFDEHDDVQQRFVAALMPRFAIEARLFEYVYAELPKDARDADINKISGFAATAGSAGHASGR